MGRISVRVSRKNLIILLVLFFVILGGTGGYLLWRVNQEETVAPTESEAGGTTGCMCCKGGGIYVDCEWGEWSICSSCSPASQYYRNEHNQCCYHGGHHDEEGWCKESDFGNPVDGAGGTFRWGSLSCNYAWECENCGDNGSDFWYKKGYLCGPFCFDPRSMCGHSACAHIGVMENAMYGLSYTTEGNGARSNGGGYIEGVTEQRNIPWKQSGTSVTAHDGVNYKFDKWSDGETKRTRTDTPGDYGFDDLGHYDPFSGERIKRIRAIYKIVPKATFKFTVDSKGTLTQEGGPVDSPGPLTQEVEPNKNLSTKRVTANTKDQSQYEFTGWRGSGGGTPEISGNSIVIKNVTGAGTYAYRAEFKEKDKIYKITYKIKTSGAENATGGNIKLDGGEEKERIEQDVRAGHNAKTVTAIAKTGYVFDRWERSGVNVGNSPSLTVTNVKSAQTYFAHFRKEDEDIVKYTLTYKVGPNGVFKGSGNADQEQEVAKGGTGRRVVVRGVSDLEKQEFFKFDKWEVDQPANVTPNTSVTPDGIEASRTDSEVKGSTVITALFINACGDETCDSWEDSRICPEDCDAACGDGYCSPDENAETCGKDCPPECGDELCTHNENARRCPEDCAAICGDNLCTHDESPETCPEDCPPNCGDDVCTDDENRENCPEDCPQECGDGYCTDEEDDENCPEDCKDSEGEESDGSVPSTGLFDETENIVIMGVALLVLGMGWTWIATLPGKVYATMSNIVSRISSSISTSRTTAKKKSIVRERESRRRRLEKRVK